MRRSLTDDALMPSRTAPLVVLVCSLVAVASAQLTEGFPLDTERIIGPDYASVSEPRVSFAPGESVGIVMWGYSACRVLSDGTILDSIPLTTDTTVNGVLDVASADGSFVYVSSEDRPTNPVTKQLVTVHIAQSGEVIGLSVIDTSCLDVRYPVLATDGEGYFLAWRAMTGSGVPLRYIRLDAAGQPIDSSPRRLTPGGVAAYDVDVAFGESTYLVVWQQSERPLAYESRAQLLRRDGTPIGDPIRLGKCLNSEDVAAAYDGHNFVALWCDDEQALRIGRISEAGVLLDSNSVFVTSDWLAYPALSSANGTTVVSWVWREDYIGFVQARRFDTLLVPLDSAPIDVSPAVVAHTGGVYPEYVSSCCTGDTFFFVWAHPWLNSMDIPYSNTNAVFRRMSSDGRLLDSACVVVSNSANAQIRPVVASDGSSFLAVWTDYRPSTSEVYCVRGALVGPDGRPQGRAFAVGSPWTRLSKVAYGGGCYVVAWYDSLDNIEAARVSRDGVILDTTPIRIASGVLLFGLDYGGGVFLATWTDDHLPWGTRLRPDGILIDTTAISLALSSVPHLSPRVASDGHAFMVVSRLYQSGSPYCFVRVDSTGCLLDTAEVVIAEYQTGGPLLTYGGGCYLVTSHVDRLSWRVTPGGTVLDTVGIPSTSRTPKASGFDGTDFVLVDTDLDSVSRLVGERITTSGVLRDSVPLVLLEGVNELTLDATCADTAGRLFVSYERTCDGAYSTTRAWAAVFSMPDAVCESPEGRMSGLVVLPSPVTTELTLAFAPTTGLPVRVELFDAAGRLVRRVTQPVLTGPTRSLSLDVRDLPAGVYVVRVVPAGLSKRFVIVR